MVRFRHPDGSQVDADTVQNGVAILIYETAPRGSVIETLDKDGTVLRTATSSTSLR
jgi:hypothetical protein